MQLLDIREVTKRFGGLAAINRVSLSVESDSICAVIGPNGAGKTTLFNLITGVMSPTEGSILFKGEEITSAQTHRISRLGIGRTFQNIRLFQSLRVIDNLAVAMAGGNPPGFLSMFTRYRAVASELRSLHAESLDLLDRLGAAALAARYPNELSYGDQRRVEIARALALKPSLLLLDEPAAGMNAKEAAVLADFVLDVRRRLGITVLLIDHNMRFVGALADWVVVLNFGQKIAEGTVAQIRAHPEVVAAYLGTEEENASAL